MGVRGGVGRSGGRRGDVGQHRDRRGRGVSARALGTGAGARRRSHLAEFDIVMTLAEHPGWVFSADQLAGDPDQGDYSPESVSVLVSRARHKLNSAGCARVIETVRGLGYRLRPLEPTEESAAAEQTRRELSEPPAVAGGDHGDRAPGDPENNARSPRCWRRRAARYTLASPSDSARRLARALLVVGAEAVLR